MEYPAISLWQPYASLIAIRAKPYETRGRKPPAKYIGTQVAIHAAKRPCVVDMPSDVADDITEAFGFCSWNHRLPRGVIVCTAKLVGGFKCGETHEQSNGRRHVEIVDHVEGANPYLTMLPVDNFGDYSPGRWAWWLVDVQPIDPPVPALGNRGWFKWRA